ncbi:RNA-guided endonuclease TnpB family protein [Nocardia sp. AG03]|uniref:RNA-guided endonuclease InsQ/TnpB family protein n=1 Tax=Nocardia sp. AG03 TaxID=3025312 RepID=UPI002418931C|nr:RNA-guided endonuclease TnpB family protein [Nocardia sp. AG03]
MASTAVKRAYRYRFYPTREQEQQLARTFGCVRYVYNRALAERSRAWMHEHRRVDYVETSKMLTAWKREPGTEWLAEPSKGPLQAALQNLQGAFDKFWRQQTGYPKFKRKGRSTESATYFANCFTYRDGRIKLAKQADPLSVVWSRPLPEGARPSQVTVSKDAAGRYHVSILVEELVADLPGSPEAIGVDAGISSLYTFSTGEKVPNPRYGERDRARLAKAQRALSRKRKGSSNRAKAQLRVARIHARIADCRRDHLHKLSTRLVRENQVIAIEDLSVRNMARNRRLARSISDTGWSQFRAIVEYKAHWYGRTVVAVDRFYPSSKSCSGCGGIVDELPLRIREWKCGCGLVHDRDINAAKNIRAVGLAALACGDGVRPSRS